MLTSRSLFAPALLGLTVLGACHHKHASTTAGDGSGAPVIAKKVSLAMTAQKYSAPDADPPQNHVFLVATDETGQSTSYPVGDFTGECSALEAEAGDLLTFQCWWAGAGTKLHAKMNVADLVILSEGVDEESAPDPLAATELKHIPMPPGAKVEAAPL